MSQPALRLVEGSSMDKSKALSAALSQIERQFGKRLSDDLRVPRRLRDVGIPEDAIPRLTEAAMKVTRLLANNPRKIAPEDAVAIYKSAY